MPMPDSHSHDLLITPAYRFDRLLTLLSRWRSPTVDHTVDGAFRRAFVTPRGPVLIEVQQAAKDRLRVHALAGTDADLSELAARARWVLALDSPLSAFWRWADDAPDSLRAPFEPIWGLPLPRSDMVFEALLYTIVEQQISWVGAQRAQRILCELAGVSISYDGVTYWCAPEPAALAALTTADLKPLKITDRRSGLLIRLAQEIVDGRLDLDALHKMDEPARLAWLRATKGIGPWTALMTHMRAFGPAQLAPSNDVALRAAVRRYLPEHAGAPDPIAAAFSPYGMYAGSAAALILSRYVIDRY